MSDAADLNTTSNGYFLRFGGTADEISLYSMVGGAPTIIIDGVDGLINSSVRATRFNIRVTQRRLESLELRIRRWSNGSLL